MLNPWQKIMRAAERGTGLRLTADEVWRLSKDDAIEQAATQDRDTDAALAIDKGKGNPFRGMEVEL